MVHACGPSLLQPRRRFARGVVLAVCAAAAWVVAPAAHAQSFSQRGFADINFTAYPQTHWNDEERLVLEGLFRWDPSVTLGPIKVDASIDVRFDTYDLTERRFDATFWDRSLQRPVIAARQLNASWARGIATVSVGKQFVRWGKTDIVVPTDRFSPRDYLNPISTDVLAVTGARVLLANSNQSLDLVFVPKMTPSRMPLFTQRWVVLPVEVRGIPVVDEGSQFSKTAQAGVRWNRIGRYVEHSLSFFRGVNHLPLIDVRLGQSPLHIDIRRDYPQLTVVGGDIAAPLPWFIVKAEAAWLGSETPEADELVLYVVQIERQVGEWLFVAGYAGEHVTENNHMFRFTPDRGLSRSVVARAGLTIDTNRNIAVETVARQNGNGFYNKFEYSQAVGAHLRFIGTAAVFTGSSEDFLGQYERNSFGMLTVRYSF